MKEVYYSEILKKYFEDKAECEKAEEEYNRKHAEELKAKETRKAEAKEVDEAYRNYINLRNAFIKKYGSYHTTYTSENTSDAPLVSIFEDVFRWPW